MGLRPVLLCVAMLLSGCAMAQEPAAPSSPIIGPAWRLERIDGEATLPTPEANLTLTPDGRALGSASCNRFTGSYRLAEGRLSIGQIASTRRLCPPPIQAQEDRFLRRLDAAERYRLDGEGRLLLLTPDGGSLALVRSEARRVVRFACENGGALTVTFGEGPGGEGTAQVAHGAGRSVLLPQQPSGSGFRYGDAGHELRGKGEEVEWSVSGGAPVRCRATR